MPLSESGMEPMHESWPLRKSPWQQRIYEQAEILLQRIDHDDAGCHVA